MLRGMRKSRGVAKWVVVVEAYRRFANWIKDRAADAPSAQRRGVMNAILCGFLVRKFGWCLVLVVAEKSAPNYLRRYDVVNVMG